MTEEERNGYHNLIFICATCHSKIDAIPHGETDYPVERLRNIKAEHEKKVREAMTEAFVGIGFPELEEATQWIMQVNPQQSGSDFSVIPPEDKLIRNELGKGSRMIITMGLSVSHEVQAFIESVEQMDHGFSERLKYGFLEAIIILRLDLFV